MLTSEHLLSFPLLHPRFSTKKLILSIFMKNETSSTSALAPEDSCDSPTTPPSPLIGSSSKSDQDPQKSSIISTPDEKSDFIFRSALQSAFWMPYDHSLLVPELYNLKLMRLSENKPLQTPFPIPPVFLVYFTQKCGILQEAGCN